MEQEKNTLTVLEIAPGQYPKQVEIDPDLKALQQAVGGNIGASYPFSDPVAIVYNDDGKLMGLPLKGGGYERWAKKHNLKEMSKTLIFLQQQKISSADELKECADAALSRYHELGDSIKTSEKRLAEIAVLKAHIINYAKTRPVYDAYRKAGYSKKFLEEHCTEITLHKAAKAAFDESNLKTLPKIKELDAEYSKLLTEKKAR